MINANKLQNAYGTVRYYAQDFKQYIKSDRGSAHWFSQWVSLPTGAVAGYGTFKICEAFGVSPASADQTGIVVGGIGATCFLMAVQMRLERSPEPIKLAMRVPRAFRLPLMITAFVATCAVMSEMDRESGRVVATTATRPAFAATPKAPAPMVVTPH